jgi:hypothetical protein
MKKVVGSGDPDPHQNVTDPQHWCRGPYAGVDYNVTLCPLQSRLQHMHLPWAIICQSRP